MTARDETGQTTVLLVGFFLVAALLVVVVVDASAAYLARQRLDALADGAALAAADGIQGREVYEQGLAELAQIDPVLARSLVAEHLSLVQASVDHPGLDATVTTTPTSVEVRLSAPLRLPFVPPGWTETARVSGTGAAVVPVLD